MPFSEIVLKSFFKPYTFWLPMLGVGTRTGISFLHGPKKLCELGTKLSKKNS
jgi:hypothetical protein